MGRSNDNQYSITELNDICNGNEHNNSIPATSYNNIDNNNDNTTTINHISNRDKKRSYEDIDKVVLNLEEQCNYFEEW
jgi:hypothetical protein